MLWRIGIITTIVASAIAVASSRSLSSPEREWAFAWVISQGDAFTVKEGSGTVDIDGGKISARLTDRRDGYTLTFSGLIDKDQLIVNLSVLDSDVVVERKFIGSYRKVMWVEDLGGESIGRESIVLTDQANVLALTREVWRPARPAPAR